jgi:hypothetical protein
MLTTAAKSRKPRGRTSTPRSFHSRMGGASNTAARISGHIAEGAHGVVTRVELVQAGITARQIDRRLSSGALLPQYPGVYRVGRRAPSLEATLQGRASCSQSCAVRSTSLSADSSSGKQHAPRLVVTHYPRPTPFAAAVGQPRTRQRGKKRRLHPPSPPMVTRPAQQALRRAAAAPYATFLFAARSARGTTNRMPERSASIEQVLLSISPTRLAWGTIAIWLR